MTFRDSDKEFEPGAVVPTTLVSEEGELAAIPEEDTETAPAVPDEVLTPGSAKGEDPVRLYLKEIGKVPLLTARQEVEIGRRIEVGQIDLRKALSGIPMAVRLLLEVGDRLRREEIPADDVIVLPEGGELDAAEIKPVLAAFARIRRLDREIDRLRSSLRDRRRSAATRLNYQKWIAANREAIQKIVADLPLKPSLIEDVVARVRRHGDRIQRLATESQRGRTAAITRELQALQEGHFRGGWRRSGASGLSDRVVRQAKRADGGQSPTRGVGGQALSGQRSLPLDLVQEGNIGLMKALDRFQYRRGFSSPPTPPGQIRQAITRAIADHCGRSDTCTWWRP
jgi:RNA polymerase primary sigma factor